MGGRLDAGRSCAAVERIFVEAKVYAAFREKLARRVAATGWARRDFDVDVGCCRPPCRSGRWTGS